MERKRNRLPKSFARRIIKVWFGGVLVPLLIVEAMMLAAYLPDQQGNGTAGSGERLKSGVGGSDGTDEQYELCLLAFAGGQYGGEGSSFIF